MQKLVLKLTALGIMLSFGGILFVSLLNLSHILENKHGTVSGMTDCPFMAHEETLCPMTVFDHLAALKGLLETTLTSVVTFTLAIGSPFVSFLFVKKFKIPHSFNTQTFFRWRRQVICLFSYRAFQDLFSHGILNPKLF